MSVLGINMAPMIILRCLAIFNLFYLPNTPVRDRSDIAASVTDGELKHRKKKSDLPSAAKRAGGAETQTVVIQILDEKLTSGVSLPVYSIKQILSTSERCMDSGKMQFMSSGPGHVFLW